MDKFKFKEFSTPSESENDRLREENARLREENDRYRAAQDGRFEDIVATLRTSEAQRDTLLAALREIVKDLEARHFDCLDSCPEAKVYAKATAAIAEVEGKP